MQNTHFYDDCPSASPFDALVYHPDDVTCVECITVMANAELLDDDEDGDQ